jgi:hypothetical protein
MEKERRNPTLQPLPTNADQNLPTPSAGRVGEPATPDSPKESIQLTLALSGAKWQGAFQLLQ